MKKILILVDGMNFAYRSAFTTQGLTAKGKPIHLVFGFLRNYISLLKEIQKQNQDAEFDSIVCWDSGYKRRAEISKKAFDEGIIDMTYKQGRRDKKATMTETEKQELADMFRQIDVLKEILQQTNLAQCSIEGEEADDICASYVAKYKGSYDFIYLVTSDQDYYQLLESNVAIYDAIKKKHYNPDSLKQEYGIEPSQWVDVCSFVGDSGDTILGCRGMAFKTTLPYIIEHKDMEGVYKHLHSLVKELREKYPDVDLTDEIKAIHPKLTTSVCSGIRIAHETKLLKKIPFPKVVLNAVEQERRVRVAYILKKMDGDLPVPEITKKQTNEYVLNDVFKEYSFFSLLNETEYLLNAEVDKVKVGKAINVVTGNIMDKKKFFCKKCGKEFMSADKIDACPDCNNKVQENQMVQLTLF